MTDDHPEPTIHVIVEQAIDAWEKRQTPRQRFLLGNLPAWGALVFTIIAVIFGVGILRAEVGTTTVRVAVNEGRIQSLERDRADLRADVAEISAKIDILLDDRRNKR